MSVYGYCPFCRSPGRLRERRPRRFPESASEPRHAAGNDHCEQGHVYPSTEAVERLVTDAERWEYVKRHVTLEYYISRWLFSLEYNGPNDFQNAIDKAIREGKRDGTA